MSGLLVEPFYRLAFGPPLVDQVPVSGGVEPSTQPSGLADPVPEEACQALVVVVGGVGGLDLCGTGLRFVLGAERLPYAFHTFSWGHGLGRWHADLTRVANRDQKAASLASLVRQFRAGRPVIPVFLVAKSGGSVVVVKALEQLDEHAVERAILLAPALSPGYDLSTALKAVRRELVVFWSPLDVVVLGAGTRIFGTADRVRSVAAGLVGFRDPNLLGAGQATPYEKLRQVRWVPAMAATGNLGGHVGPDSPIFLRRYVLPLLRAAQASPR
jgi:hypothetical protein